MSTSHLAVLLVAFAGAGGLGTLGAAFKDDIAGGGRAACVPESTGESVRGAAARGAAARGATPVSVAAQAGAAELLRELAESARLAKGTGTTARGAASTAHDAADVVRELRTAEHGTRTAERGAVIDLASTATGHAAGKTTRVVDAGDSAAARGFTVGLDLDGVTAKPTARWLARHFVGLVDSVVKSGFGFSLRERFHRIHDVAANEHHIYRDMGVARGAADVLGDLQDAGAKVHVITARPTETSRSASVARDTLAWLRDAGIFPDQVSFPGKTSKTNFGTHMLVDDSPRNIRAAADAGVPYVIYNRWYNRHLSGPRARSWEDVGNLVRAQLAEFERVRDANIADTAADIIRLD